MKDLHVERTDQTPLVLTGPNSSGDSTWVEDKQAWCLEIRYKSPKDHRVKIYVEHSVDSPFVSASSACLDEAVSQ